MMLAIQHPEDSVKLMIVDSLPFFSLIMGAPDVAAAEPEAVEIRDAILAETQQVFEQRSKQFLPIIVKSPEGLKAATRWIIASDKAVFARAMYELMTTDLRPKLHEIKTPVTMLYPWDAASPFSREATDSFYKNNLSTVPNKTLVCIPNAFHLLMLDQPKAFAAQVESFVK